MPFLCIRSMIWVQREKNKRKTHDMGVGREKQTIKPTPASPPYQREFTICLNDDEYSMWYEVLT